MATSGTVAQTVIDTAKLVEHSIRRVGLAASIQTPETIQIANESLYILLLSLANRGINLWCIEKKILGVETGKATYVTPAGTLDVENVVYSMPSRATGTDSTSATSAATELSSATTIVRIGVKMSSVAAADVLTFESSADGSLWTTFKTDSRTDWASDEWYWFDLDPTIDAKHFRVSFINATTFSEFYLASYVNDLPLTQWNRDTFTVINNKSQQGRPATCYYFEKLLTPQFTVWPVPNNDYDQITIWRHRQIQDIGSLTQQVEIPQRWMEDIIWQLALRIGFELPGVDPNRLKMLSEMAEKHLIEAEMDETDGSDTQFNPGIGAYTA